MKTVKCQNVVEGQKCGRVLAILTDLQIEILQVDPEKGSIFRCPKCHPEQRWSQISVSKDGKNTIVSLGNNDMQGKFPDEVQFVTKLICEQVA